MKLKEIAERISKHLKRFEADKEINIRTGRGTSRFYFANARHTGRFVQITYITYQGFTSLSKAEAEKYLAWLDAGNIGWHYKALEDVDK